MWKNEFKRLFLKKQTFIIILILITLGVINFIISYNDRQLYIDTLNKGYEDINSVAMENLINNYNGMKFNLDFYLTSDLFQIFVIVLFLFCGIFLSSNLQNMIESGQENFIISRIKYSSHLKTILKSQSAYICSIIAISLIIISILGFIIGGYGSGITFIGIYSLNMFWTIVIIIFQIILLSLLLCLINGICLMSNIIIKNKLVIQCLPFALFMVAPMIISSTIGNMIPIIGNVTGYFVPFNLTSIVYWLLQYRFDIITIICMIVPVVFYIFLFIFLLKKNIKVFDEDCI